MAHHVISHYYTQPSYRVCLIHHMTCLHFFLLFMTLRLPLVLLCVLLTQWRVGHQSCPTGERLFPPLHCTISSTRSGNSVAPPPSMVESWVLWTDKYKGHVKSRTQQSAALLPIFLILRPISIPFLGVSEPWFLCCWALTVTYMVTLTIMSHCMKYFSREKKHFWPKLRLTHI